MNEELRQAIANHRFTTVHEELNPRGRKILWVLGESGADEIMQLIDAHVAHKEREALGKVLDITFQADSFQEVIDYLQVQIADNDRESPAPDDLNQRLVEARLNEAFLIGIKYEKGEYLPATYLIDRRAELQPPTTERGE